MLQNRFEWIVHSVEIQFIFNLELALITRKPSNLAVIVSRGNDAILSNRDASERYNLPQMLSPGKEIPMARRGPSIGGTTKFPLSGDVTESEA